MRFASSANGVNSRTKNLNNNDENDDDDDDAYFLDEYKVSSNCWLKLFLTIKTVINRFSFKVFFCVFIIDN